MLSNYCPRLSEAKTLLPLLRAQLVTTAARYSLPVDISLELLPIVEDALFGYELVPDRNTHTYFTIGFCETGEAALRRAVLCTSAPCVLRLAAVKGESVAGDNFRPRISAQQRDVRFGELSDAVESGFSQLVRLFPDRPRKPIGLRVDVHQYLDEALSIAHTRLSHWNPFIQFFGLPNEAQYGFILRGDDGEQGELVSRRPDMWVLRWKSPESAICEEWNVVPPDLGATHKSARA